MPKSILLVLQKCTRSFPKSKMEIMQCLGEKVGNFHFASANSYLHV